MCNLWEKVLTGNYAEFILGFQHNVSYLHARGFATMPLDMIHANAAYAKQRSIAVLLDKADVEWSASMWDVALPCFLPSPNGVDILTSLLIRCMMNAVAIPTIPRKHMQLHVVT